MQPSVFFLLCVSVPLWFGQLVSDKLILTVRNKTTETRRLWAIKGSDL